MTVDRGYDAVVFDLDGTLIDSTEGIVASFEATYRSLTLDYPGREAIVQTISMPLEDQLDALSLTGVDDFIEVYREHYRVISPGRTDLFDGARELLHALHADDVPLGVATSKSRPAAEMLLRHLEIFDLLAVCVGREDVTHPKPHPEPLLMAAEQLTVVPHRMVYVGDSPFDVEAAARAGAMCVAVTTGAGGAAVLEGTTPDAMFENLAGVMEHLRIRRPVERTRTGKSAN